MKRILCTLMVLTATHSYAAGQAKVKVAAHAITQMGSAALQAAKANKFRTTMLTSTLAFAGYAKYRHGWYDRELARLEKLQKQRQAYKHKTVHGSLSSNKNHGHCPPEIADLINDYAGADEQDLKIEGEIKKVKAAATAAKKITLKHFLTDSYTGRLQHRNPGPYMANMLAGFMSLSLLLNCTLLFPSLNFIQFGIFKLLRLKMFLIKIDSHPVSLVPDETWEALRRNEFIQINNWRELFDYSKTESKQLLRTIPIITGIFVALATVVNTKAWLDKRDRRAARAAWIADHQ